MDEERILEMVNMYLTEHYTIGELRDHFSVTEYRVVTVLKKRLGERYSQIAKRIMLKRKSEGYQRMSADKRKEASRKRVRTLRARGFFKKWSKDIASHRRKTGEFKHTDESKRKMSAIKRTAIAEGRWTSPTAGRKHTPETREKLSKITKQMWQAGAFSYGRGVYRSQLEKRVLATIVKRYPQATHSKTITSEGESYCFDVHVPELNMLIEVNGDYWHYNPLLFEGDHFDKSRLVHASDVWKRDEEKRQAGIKAGYTVITLWQTDINSMSNSELLERIEDA